MYLLDLVSEPLEAALLVGGLAPLLEAPGVAKTVRGGPQVGAGWGLWGCVPVAAGAGAVVHPAPASDPGTCTLPPQVAQALAQQFSVALAGARY